MRRALVMAGGGARGAFQIGMLRGLILDRGLDFSILRGVSAGALNAAFLAQAPVEPDSLGALRANLENLEGIWRSEIQGNASVYEERPGGFLGVAAGADSLYSIGPLRELLGRHLSLNALRTSGRNFKVGTVSLVSGEFAEAEAADPAFMERLIASASIPVVFPFVDLKPARDVLVDGGARNITPLASAFDAEPDEIYVLLTSRLIRKGNGLPPSGVGVDNYDEWRDNFIGLKVSGFDVLKRTVDILSDEIYLDDLRVALGWNEVVSGVAEVARLSSGAPADLHAAIQRLSLSLSGKRYVPLYVLAPQDWFGAENSATDFSPELIRKAIDHGQEIAADPKRWLWPPVVA